MKSPDLIADLLAEKRQQLILIKRHIGMLERMAKEEQPIARIRSAPAGNGASNGTAADGDGDVHAVKHRTRVPRPDGQTRTGLAASFLEQHSGPHSARDIASAVGCSPSQIHSALAFLVRKGVAIRDAKNGAYLHKAAATIRSKGTE